MTTASSTRGWDPRSYARHSPVQTSEGEALIEVLAPAEGERVLDLGCGDGRLTAAVQGRGADVVGLDLSQEMAAATAARGVPAVVADAAVVPLPNGSVNAVFSNAALHWVRDHEQLIAEIARVLAHGGRAAIRTGAAGNQWRMETTALSLLFSDRFRDYRPEGFRSPWTMADPGLWMVALREHGMAVDELFIDTTPSGWSSADDVARWFATIAHPFTRHMPDPVAEQYITAVADTGWAATDTTESFVRLVVRARKGH